MAGLASAAAAADDDDDVMYLFGRLVGDLLLGWRSGEGSRPRRSALLCEHEDTHRRPLGVGPAHVPLSGADTGDGAELPPDADFPGL